MSCGNDNKEIAAESPYQRTEDRQLMTEVEGTQKDVESQQIDKHIPHVVGKPQVVGVHHA